MILGVHHDISLHCLCRAGGAGGAQPAKDALGNDITVAEWTKTHLPGDRSLSQGLKGDPTYLIVNDGGGLESYGLNAVCTHLGCVVPWNQVCAPYSVSRMALSLLCDDPGREKVQVSMPWISIRWHWEGGAWTSSIVSRSGAL